MLPSGTAITLAEGILENMDRKDKWVKERSLHRTVPSAALTPALPTSFLIDSIREGEVFGIHTIRYESDSRQHFHHARCQESRRLCIGAILGCRIHGPTRGISGHEVIYFHS